MDYIDSYETWQRRLAERFPDRDSPERIAEWSAFRQRLNVGDRVDGQVIARAHFGAWIDIGAGIPALLEIINIEGLTPERYRKGDWCVPGQSLSVFIRYINDEPRAIALSTKPLDS
jgi:ribosomal protein S1